MFYYVVKPLDVDTEPKVFSRPEAAKEYIDQGDHGADVCEYAKIEAVNVREAAAKFNAGQCEKRLIPRQLTKREIEELERRDAISFLRDLGL
jgi:hypothetical protein